MNFKKVQRASNEQNERSGDAKDQLNNCRGLNAVEPHVDSREITTGAVLNILSFISPLRINAAAYTSSYTAMTTEAFWTAAVLALFALFVTTRGTLIVLTGRSCMCFNWS